VQKLLENKLVDYSITNNDNQNFVMEALESGSLEVLEYLKTNKTGIKIIEQFSNYNTLFDLITSDSKLNVISELKFLEFKTSELVEIKNKEGLNVMQKIAYNSQYNCMDWLLNTIQFQNQSNTSELDDHSKTKELIETLVLDQDSNGLNSVMISILQNDAKMFSKLHSLVSK